MSAGADPGPGCYSRGEDVRQPEMNRADLMAPVAACRTGTQRIRELCERFGTDGNAVDLSLLQVALYCRPGERFKVVRF